MHRQSHPIPTRRGLSPAQPPLPEIAPLGLIAAEAALDRLARTRGSADLALVRRVRANLSWAAETMAGFDPSARAPLDARIRAAERTLTLGRR
jgi:hypothetical protein